MHKSLSNRHLSRTTPLLISALLVATLGGVMATHGTATAEPVRTRFVEAELVSEVKAIQPGEPFHVALRLAMDPEWHTYWENPGDTGLPTTLEWDLPKGFAAGELRFPYPHRFVSSSYVSYGYEGEVLILQTITPPADLTPGGSVHLGGRADWTVCREDLCMPGGADLGLELDVAAAAKPDGYWKNRFAGEIGRQPAVPEGWRVAAHAEGAKLVLTLTPEAGAPHDPGAVEVFERKSGTIDRAEPPALSRTDESLVLAIALPGRKRPSQIDVVLVAANGWGPDGSPRALTISTPIVSR